MKIKVQIDSVFQEEMLQIQAPSRTPKIQQVVEFVESLDDNQRLKGKKDGETRQVLAETIQGEYHLGLRLYQVLEKLPSYFIKISQSEIVNLKEIERFNITPNGLVEIHLKNKETTYSSRRYLKAIKEKLQ